MKKEAIIFVAAGQQQLLPISIAKKMGFAVIGVDKNPNAPAFEIVDEAICLSAYKAEPIIDKIIALKESYNFRAVITRSSGIPVVTTAAISEALKLPGVDIDGADSIIHKTKFAKRCAACGISAPENQSAASTNEIDWKSIKYPAILKPSLGLVGQKGLCVVNSSTELVKKFDVALSAAYDNRVEIEFYEQGDDVVLMAVVKDSVLKPIVLLDEMNQLNESNQIQRMAFSVPSRYSVSETETQIHDIARQIVKSFGIKSSPFLLSLKVREGKLPAVIELHLDLGGDKVLDKLLPASTDFDFIQFTISNMTGIEPSTFKTESVTFKPFTLYYNPFHIEQSKNFDAVFFDESCGVFPGQPLTEAVNY